MKRIDVLVTDAGGNHALAVIRSLGRRGLRVAAADSRRTAMGLYSRYCVRAAVYPGAEQGARGFAAGLERILERLRPGLLLPVTERTILGLLRSHEAIRAMVRSAPMPPPASLRVAFDKEKTIALARSLRLPVPRTEMVGDAAALAALPDRAATPAVIKPRASEREDPDGRILPTGPVEYALRPADLVPRYLEVHRRAPFPLVQEFVPGEGYGIAVLCDRGRVRALFAYRRLRMLRPTGSGSTLRESIEPPPDMARGARLLMEALQWHGVAMVEFKRDDRDGSARLMEINGRFWNSLPLAIAAGIDFPWLLYRLAMEGECPESFDYKVGVRCRWLAGDARHLAAALRGRPAGWTDRFPSRGRALLDFLRFTGRDLHYDDLWISDPVPFLAQAGDALARALPRPRATEERRAALPRVTGT